jgi:antibiotic biosynthesis monooxygenase (ABM) superfamily enzyme
MAKIFLALFLIIFGLNLVFGLNIPIWVTGVLALIAGVMLLMEYFSVSVAKK